MRIARRGGFSFVTVIIAVAVIAALTIFIYRRIAGKEAVRKEVRDVMGEHGTDVPTDHRAVLDHAKKKIDEFEKATKKREETMGGGK